MRYLTQLFAYLLLAANPYPLFTGTERYPIDLESTSPRRNGGSSRCSGCRWRCPCSWSGRLPGHVRRRLVLLLGRGDDDYSAGATSSSVGILWTVALFAWFACLVLGRMPMGFRNLQAYGLRYFAQVWATCSFSPTATRTSIRPTRRAPGRCIRSGSRSPMTSGVRG